MKTYRFSLILLRGLGQIMLQENAATGLLFLAGIFYGSPFMGLAAILAVCCGTITAQVLRYDQSEIEKGFYGFSAALVGPALILYFEPVWLVWPAIIAGSIAATILQHLFIVKKIPVFTLPFVLVTWGIIWLFQQVYPLAPSKLLSNSVPVASDLTFALKGFGQVIFQGSVFAGLAFFTGVFIQSPISALYGLAGALAAGILSFWCSVPVGEIGMGLLSYNAVLCAIVFAGNQVKDGLWVLISVVLTVAIGLTMRHYQLIQLTFPFVAAACMTLFFKNLVSRKK
ncbi:urea transporter [Fluviicola sp.]|uniref:urea transporter n=1 Tax=Fluviicola sp. TaxID=1917219 RepID=UPI002601C948|nr:urea transporter [Fluviicola sp.]